MPPFDTPPIPVVLRIDPPRSGLENMAIDAELLEGAASDQQIIMRLYRWQEPTLSLGHFQTFDDLAADRSRIEAKAALRLEELPWVRRRTGGGAILHDQEWTYSLVVPHAVGGLGQADRNKGHNEALYRAIHEAIRDGLRSLGLPASLSEQCSCSILPTDAPFADGERPEAFLCFQRRTPVDLVIGEHKVLGSAQRRNRGGLLQHGSLLLRASARFPCLLGVEDLVAPAVFADVPGRKGRHSMEGKLPEFAWDAWLAHRLREGLNRVYHCKYEDWELKDSNHLVVSQ
jgi:lipoyl(octanoyl) transferase